MDGTGEGGGMGTRSSSFQSRSQMGTRGGQGWGCSSETKSSHPAPGGRYGGARLLPIAKARAPGGDRHLGPMPQTAARPRSSDRSGASTR